MPPVRSYVGIHEDEAEPHWEREALGTGGVLQVQDEHQGDSGKVATN